MSRRPVPSSLSFLALAAGAATLTLVLFMPAATADLTVGVCVWQTAQAEVPLEGYPPGNTFIGVYAGPGTHGVYTSRGAFTSACNTPGLRMPLAP